jgi:hypothetical protein
MTTLASGGAGGSHPDGPDEPVVPAPASSADDDPSARGAEPLPTIRPAAAPPAPGADPAAPGADPAAPGADPAAPGAGPGAGPGAAMAAGPAVAQTGEAELGQAVQIAVVADDLAERRARASQSFWTLVVGVPAIFSVLRLGVEAGGELQTTLLLVANVGPVNLVAGFVTTAARLVSTALVAVFAIGGVLAASTTRPPTTLAVPGGAGRAGPLRRRPLFARWVDITPAWFVLASFAVAVATWQISYLPLLVPAFAAAFQITPYRIHEQHVPRVLIIGTALAAYGWLLLPTLRDAARQGEVLLLLLFIAPPVLAIFIAGPLPPLVTRLLAPVTQVAVLGMLVWAALPVITTPVLPLTVTTVRVGDGVDEDIRGHVITTDDVNMVILQERGGVRYVPVDHVESQVLCPAEEELPRHRLRVRDFHVDDSLFEGLGRRVRPLHRVDAACRTVLTP